MNAKEKHHINSRFFPLVAALCFVCLLLSAPAPAGPTTGQLQQQIDELTAHVNRLRALIEDPNDKSYTSGIAAVSSSALSSFLPQPQIKPVNTDNETI